MAANWVLPVALLGAAGIGAYLLTRPSNGGSRSAAAPQETTGVVSAAKQRLQQLGYYTGPIDGNVTQAFRDAVWGFQFDSGIDQTGVLDQRTGEALSQPNAATATTGSAQPVQGFGDRVYVGNRCYAARF